MDENNAYTVALSILAKRDYSYLELQQKLQKKGFNNNVITNVLNELIKKNYQNDDRFAENFIKTRVDQGKGKLLIQMQLKQHNITDANFDEYDFFMLAKKTKIKKFGNKIAISNKDKSKQMRFLQQRGFSFDEINYAIN